jgi:hypothetical protein
MTAIVPDDLTSTLKAILDHLVRLDTRLDKIDTRLDGMDTRLRTLEVTVARMDGRLMQLPTLVQTIGLIFMIMTGTFGILAAAKLWL